MCIMVKRITVKHQLHLLLLRIQLFVLNGWFVHVLMRDENNYLKEERSKQGQTNNKAKQHSTPN